MVNIHHSNVLFILKTIKFSFIFLIFISVFQYCKPIYKNKSGVIEQHFFESLKLDENYPFIKMSSYGTSEDMSPKTKEFHVFFDLKEYHFEKDTKSRLDTIADKLMVQISKDLLPKHHLYNQINKINVNFETETIPADTIDNGNFIIFRSKSVYEEYIKDSLGIFKKIRSELKTHSFEKLTSDYKKNDSLIYFSINTNIF